ncbi:hypothetical protein M9H77_01073 [Catharanthus roseus]|uniref:Uncharacterized protein n=1 Tax=Catharanthus roseus TaxID=4058 RepID=A0ACC0C4H9_CATRO|nr:hypothetical protein M9H77_01073 [Catharanthus roseus]
MQLGAYSYFRIDCSAGKYPFVPATVSMAGAVVCDADNTTDHSHQKNKKRPRRVTVAKKPTKEVKTSDDIEDINFSTDEALEIRASLLKWYDENQRDLPWRRISNSGGNDHDNEDVEESERRAYAVWVSEVMLQQTRVQTVIDYFNRWMNKWPTLRHLSQASLEEVNEMWAGLGYYRRARFLLEGAKMVVDEGAGFPREVSALRRVKGIGEYTAGAIASIAFKEVVPVVDGNVIRVLARLKAISRNPKDTATVKKIWKLAGELVDDCRPGDFNQALMELGATVCTPLSPSCSLCPISTQCRALSLSKLRESMLVTDYPIKVVKAKQRDEYAAVSVVEVLEGQDSENLQSNNKFLLVKRADKGLLAGLWEFPSVLLKGEADLTTRTKATNQFLKSSFNLVPGKSCNIVSREDVGEYVHVFSHIRLKMYIELIVIQLQDLKNVRDKKQGEERWKYVDREALSSMGLTSGVRKVYSMIESYKQSKSSSSILAKARPRKASRI